MFCHECMIQLHPDCSKDFTFNADSFAKIIQTKSSKINRNYFQFKEALFQRGLDFTPKKDFECFLNYEMERVEKTVCLVSRLLGQIRFSNFLVIAF